MKTKPKRVNLMFEMIEPLSDMLNPKTARRVADFKIDARTSRRIQVLGKKCNFGKLTADERAEYESIVRDLNLIAILKLKARAILRDAAE